MVKRTPDFIDEKPPAPLSLLIGNADQTHVGFIYQMGYEEALVLTNDSWKYRVAGIPQNSFLIATALKPGKENDTPFMDQEVILMRVAGPVFLPQHLDLIQTRIEQCQRHIQPQQIDPWDGYDPITMAELQYGGLRCRVLGTFYMQNDRLSFGSDIQNFCASSHLRVYKPDATGLSAIFNYIDPTREAKALQEARSLGFPQLPHPFLVGNARFTSTDRNPPGDGQPKVPVFVQPCDFLARRTAVFGMTRTGKSNTVKTLMSAVKMASLTGNAPVGQLVVDVRGEYSNANHQDDDSSISDVFTDTIRYRSIKTPGFEDLRSNFYLDPAEGLSLLSRLSQNDPYRNSSTDLQAFLSDSLEEPEPEDRSGHKRWERKRALYQCILYAAGFAPPDNFVIRFDAAASVLKQIADVTGRSLPDPRRGLSLPQATDWFLHARRADLDLQKRSRTQGYQGEPCLRRDKSSDPWFDPNARAYVNVLARLNDRGSTIRGWRALAPYSLYHSPRRNADVAEEIYEHLVRGRIVILDLSVGQEIMRKTLAKRIAQHIFDRSMQCFASGMHCPNILLYIEEAHNLIPRTDDLTDTWPAIAKEGGKANVGLVYCTQEPSSIHPSILGNSENMFVTHLNNQAEIDTIAKYCDFADYKSSLRMAADVGFARVKMLSSPIVVPVQISRFEPAALKAQIAAITANRSSAGAQTQVAGAVLQP